MAGIVPLDIYNVKGSYLELGVVDDFRTFDWVGEIKYPELVYQQSIRFLQ